ncbi:MAG: hypothetical protein M3263_02300, partial [Thermoproteota archaeon]|nr:hypothetical protein [Thermoproteota archaeon]
SGFVPLKVLLSAIRTISSTGRSTSGAGFIRFPIPHNAPTHAKEIATMAIILLCMVIVFNL